MLFEFLKSQHSIKKTLANSVYNSAKHWKKEGSHITRGFVFESFQEAVRFQGIVSDYLTHSGLQFNVNNVYNNVSINILDELSPRGAETVKIIDEMFENRNNTFDNHVKNVLKRALNPERLEIMDNHQHIPTSYRDNAKDFFLEKKRELLH